MHPTMVRPLLLGRKVRKKVPSRPVPPKKRRKQSPSSSPHSSHLLIPLESRLEESPAHQQRGQGFSSTDSSESDCAQSSDEASLTSLHGSKYHYPSPRWWTSA